MQYSGKALVQYFPPVIGLIFLNPRLTQTISGSEQSAGDGAHCVV